jgi:hypothetical protein
MSFKDWVQVVVGVVLTVAAFGISVPVGIFAIIAIAILMV